MCIVYNTQSKVSTELTEMSQERDFIERELKDALSAERETVKDLQTEVEQLKVISVHMYYIHSTCVCNTVCVQILV